MKSTRSSALKITKKKIKDSAVMKKKKQQSRGSAANKDMKKKDDLQSPVITEEDRLNRSNEKLEDTPSTPKKNTLTSHKNANITPSSKMSITDLSESQTGRTTQPTDLFESGKRVKKVYKIIQRSTGALGGNGYNGAIYGELTLHSMQKVIDFLVEKCELRTNSMFIDVGSGLGKPNFHVSQDPGVVLSIGIELEEIRWQLAMQNLKAVLEETCNDSDQKEIPLFSGVNFIHGDIFDVVTTDPFTHIYMYDLGFPPPLQRKIAEYFNASTHAKYLVSYRPPRRVIHEYHYEVEEIGKMQTSMMGSGESHTAYFYKRTSVPAPCIERAETSLLRVPSKDGSSVTVVCSNYFKGCIELAFGSVDELSQQVKLITDKILNSGRPKRERKQRNLNIL